MPSDSSQKNSGRVARIRAVDPASMVPKITAAPAISRAGPPIRLRMDRARDQPGFPHQPAEDQSVADTHHDPGAKPEGAVMQRDQRLAGDNQRACVRTACLQAQGVQRQQRHDAKGDEYALGQPRRHEENLGLSAGGAIYRGLVEIALG